jgi:MFS family permease
MQESEQSYRGPAFARALRHRTFAFYYGGLVFSSFGTSFTQVAITWQMYELTHSALQLGFLGLSRAASLIPFLLVGGLLADAIDRRRLMILTQTGQMLITGGLLIMTATGSVSAGMFYVAAVLASICTAAT